MGTQLLQLSSRPGKWLSRWFWAQGQHPGEGVFWQGMSCCAGLGGLVAATALQGGSVLPSVPSKFILMDVVWSGYTVVHCNKSPLEQWP